MKLFYFFAAVLTLLCGVAAAAILQPIAPATPAQVTFIPPQEKTGEPGKTILVKNKQTENRCGIRSI